MTDTRRLILTILMAAWVCAFVYAFFYLTTTEPTGDSFTRGLNRITGYLGWQGIAGMISVAIVAVGRGWPKGSAVRHLSWLPFIAAMVHVVGILGVIAYASMG